MIWAPVVLCGAAFLGATAEVVLVRAGRLPDRPSLWRLVWILVCYSTLLVGLALGALLVLTG